jgi:hypothetical protein
MSWEFAKVRRFIFSPSLSSSSSLLIYLFFACVVDTILSPLWFQIMCGRYDIVDSLVSDYV